jgi:hypothetical protein
VQYQLSGEEGNDGAVGEMVVVVVVVDDGVAEGAPLRPRGTGRHPGDGALGIYFVENIKYYDHPQPEIDGVE